jgi:hypothetical protein
MTLSRSAALALLSLATVPPTLAPIPDEPLPRGVSTITGPKAETWTKKTAHVEALRVRLGGLGARTHKNWVLFRLPFDSRQWDRVRYLRFAPHATAPTDVGAFLLGNICVRIPSAGSVATWTRYTVSGMGWTLELHTHPTPATDDPTIVAINIPTRVANYVACGWDHGHLDDPSTWSLDLSWEER